ncbi:MAG: glycoside hydrolase family 25 protein [Akkermansiaceae bacterium]
MCIPRLTSLVLSLISLCLFSSCGSQYGKVSYKKSPTIINVSSYDPKETQRSGNSYSPLDQSSLRRNGGLGQIARCSKGYTYDSKCSDFLVGAERQGMLLGAYHYVTPNSSATAQADRFVARLRSIKRTRSLRTSSIMLVGDIDSKCTVPQMIAFIKRIKSLTGTYPMIYIENGELIRSRLRNASFFEKRILKKCPYWLALYSPNYPSISTPKKLIQATDVWKTWSLWQYGGVEWEGGRSRPKHYVKGSWKTPRYLGDLAKPLERNGFNGSQKELYKFWAKHSWRW